MEKIGKNKRKKLFIWYSDKCKKSFVIGKEIVYSVTSAENDILASIEYERYQTSKASLVFAQNGNSFLHMLHEILFIKSAMKINVFSNLDVVENHTFQESDKNEYRKQSLRHRCSNDSM